MRELLERRPTLSLYDRADFLLDTCFFVWTFDHHKEHDLLSLIEHYRVAMTTFNYEELMHIEHKLKSHTKENIRHFLRKDRKLFTLSIPVHPGSWQMEHEFVVETLPEMDRNIHDPSDAVLLAAAVRVHAYVLTRDKHDIFNAHVENFMQKRDIKVFNSYHMTQEYPHLIHAHYD